MKDNEQKFETLTVLLRLKQHEVPPPGYFSGFSSKVISAIEAQEAARKANDHGMVANWLTGFLSIFDSRPGLVGGLATSVMVFLVLGVVLADRSDSDIASSFAVDQSSPQGSAPLASASVPTGLAPSDVSSGGGITVSTNPVTSLQPSSAFFGQDPSLFQMASYSPGGSGH